MFLRWTQKQIWTQVGAGFSYCYTSDPPGQARLGGDSPVPHHLPPTTSGDAGRPVAGLPSAGRRTRLPKVVYRGGCIGALKTTAVGGHPLWAVAHADGSETDASSTEDWQRVVSRTLWRCGLYTLLSPTLNTTEECWTLPTYGLMSPQTSIKVTSNNSYSL